MAETPLTDSIEALTTYANQVTGESDTNLSDAVYTLAQGFGGGGSVKIERGTFTPEVDTPYAQYRIPHSLGEAPDFVIVRSNLDATAEATQTYSRIQACYGAKKSFNVATQGDFAYLCVKTRPGYDASTNTTEGGGALTVNAAKFLKQDYFVVPAYNSTDYVAGGYTYEYIIGKVVA